VIGRYHLLDRIGEGGMGEVWRAEQKEPVRRRVALKLVKAGMNTREVMRRFEIRTPALGGVFSLDFLVFRTHVSGTDIENMAGPSGRSSNFSVHAQRP